MYREIEFMITQQCNDVLIPRTLMALCALLCTIGCVYALCAACLFPRAGGSQRALSLKT